MRTEAEVLEKVAWLESNFSLISEKIRNEMQKDYYRRDYRLLVFLNAEKKVWEFALSEMKWLFENEQD